MKRYRDNPMTPNMRAGLLFLANQPDGPHEVTCVGQPTRFRLVKFGYAQFVQPTDPLAVLLTRRGDWPMRITGAGRQAAAAL